MSEEATETRTYPENVTQIVDLFLELNVRDLLDLQEALKEKGIEPAAAAAVAMPMGPGAGEDAVEVQTAFDVILKSFGAKKIQVIKEVRAVTSLGLLFIAIMLGDASTDSRDGLDLLWGRLGGILMALGLMYLLSRWRLAEWAETARLWLGHEAWPSARTKKEVF